MVDVLIEGICGYEDSRFLYKFVICILPPKPYKFLPCRFKAYTTSIAVTVFRFACSVYVTASRSCDQPFIEKDNNTILRQWREISKRPKDKYVSLREIIFGWKFPSDL